MIDFDSLSLYAEHVNLVTSHMMNYVTIFFALVVTSHFVAKNLPTSLVFFILLIYTAFAISNLHLIGETSGHPLLNQAEISGHPLLAAQ